MAKTSLIIFLDKRGQLKQTQAHQQVGFKYNGTQFLFGYFQQLPKWFTSWPTLVQFFFRLMEDLILPTMHNAKFSLLINQVEENLPLVKLL